MKKPKHTISWRHEKAPFRPPKPAATKLKHIAELAELMTVPVTHIHDGVSYKSGGGHSCPVCYPTVSPATPKLELPSYHCGKPDCKICNWMGFSNKI